MKKLNLPERTCVHLANLRPSQSINQLIDRAKQSSNQSIIQLVNLAQDNCSRSGVGDAKPTSSYHMAGV
jgi:hypothetical protein